MKLLRTAVCASGIVALSVVTSGLSPQSTARAAAGPANAAANAMNRSDGGDRVEQIDKDVLIAREAAWRAYFAGDVQTLGGLLPPEFIGIGMNESPFADLATTLAGAREFREKGGRLVRLAFPETRAQRFGDTVVIYGRFEVVLETGGAERTLRGRLTEMFVRRDGKWWHPGWHLDLTAAPAASQP